MLQSPASSKCYYRHANQLMLVMLTCGHVKFRPGKMGGQAPCDSNWTRSPSGNIVALELAFQFRKHVFRPRVEITVARMELAKG